jgi:putative oxidoreductase
MLNKKNDWALLALRLVFGVLMIINHGWPKLSKALHGNLDQFANPIGLGSEVSLILTIVAEFGCSLLLMLGLFTRWASVPLIFTMLVIIFVVNVNKPLGDIEMAILYLGAYVALFLAGPGWFSLDAQVRKKV